MARATDDVGHRRRESGNRRGRDEDQDSKRGRNAYVHAHDAAASPRVAVSTAAVPAVLALVRAFATSLFKSMVPSSFLHESLQTTERFVPSLRDVLEIGSRYFHLFWLELPDALAATS